MRVILPTVITPAILKDSNVLENDAPAWSSTVTYTKGQTVLVDRKVYEALGVGTNLNKPPATEPTFWLDTGFDNRWRMFDQKVGTLTERATPLVVKLTPGIVSDMALLNVDAESVDVVMKLAGATVWSASMDLRSSETVLDWYDYFFMPFRAKTDAVFTGMPPYATAELTITIAKPLNPVAVGTLIVGTAINLGNTLISPKIGIVDYSKKEPDAWGDYYVVERAFSKRMSAEVLVDNKMLDEVFRTLAKYRATPLLWSGGIGRFSSLIVYGFYKSFELDIAFSTHAHLSLDIEGLT